MQQTWHLQLTFSDYDPRKIIDNWTNEWRKAMQKCIYRLDHTSHKINENLIGFNSWLNIIQNYSLNLHRSIIIKSPQFPITQYYSSLLSPNCKNAFQNVLRIPLVIFRNANVTTKWKTLTNLLITPQKTAYRSCY